MKHLLIFLVCSLLVNSMTADNLFGDGEMTREQNRWRVWPTTAFSGQFRRDKNIFTSPPESARVIVKPQGKAVVFCVVPLKPETTYLLSLKYRRDKVAVVHQPPKLTVFFRDAANGRNGSAGTLNLTLPFVSADRWETFKTEFTTGVKTQAGQFSIFLSGIPGTYWFDELSLSPVADVVKVPKNGGLSVDGNAAAWKDTAELNRFYRNEIIGKASPPNAETDVRLAYDNEALYVGFINREPAMAALKTTQTKRDAPVYQDDCNELFIATKEGRCFQFMINSVGNCADAERFLSELGNPFVAKAAWNDSGWTCGAARGKEMWSSTFRIPWSTLGLKTVPEELSVNFARERYAGERENSHWQRSGENFGNFRKYALLRLGKDNGTIRRYMEVHDRDPLKIERMNTKFKELQSDCPGGYIVGSWGHGARLSSYPAAYRKAHPDPKKLYEKYSREIGEAGMFTAAYPWLQELGGIPAVRRNFERYGTKTWYCANSSWHRAEVIKRGTAQYFKAEAGNTRNVDSIDPAYRQLIRDVAGDAIRRDGKALKGLLELVLVYDEPMGYATFANFSRTANPESRALDAVDQEIREKFGAGKYGLFDFAGPRPPDRRAAERSRIATVRWWNGRAAQEAAKDFEFFHKILPGVPVMTYNFCYMYGLNYIDVPQLTRFTDITSSDPYPTATLSHFGKERALYHTGFATKYLKELSKKPVATMPQGFIYCGMEPTPERIREWAAQALKNGAEMLFWYTEGPFRYTCPDAYLEMLRVNGLARRMNRLKLPKKTSTAIFVSYPSMIADQDKGQHAWYTLYTMMGERLKRNFSFLADSSLAQGTDTLDNYRLLFVTRAHYADRDTAAKLADYVENGGTLVVFDPDFLRYAPDDADLSPYRRKLIGEGTGRPVSASFITVVNRAFGLSHGTLLPLMPLNHVDNEFSGKILARTLSVPEGAEVTVHYPDGSPAGFRHKVGKGEVIFFAAQPFGDSTLATSGNHWLDVVRFLLDKNGEPVTDIWDFLFPATGGGLATGKTVAAPVLPKLRPAENPSGLRTYVQKVKLDFPTAEAAKNAQMKIMPLPYGKTVAFSARWDDICEAHLRMRSLMAKYGIKGNFYLQNLRYGKYEASWRRDYIRHLTEGGFRLGTHGMWHRKLTEIPPRLRFREIAMNRAELEAASDLPVNSHAFAFGRFAVSGKPEIGRDIAEVLLRCGILHSVYANFVASAQGLRETDFSTVIAFSPGDRNTTLENFDRGIEQALKNPRLRSQPNITMGVHAWQKGKDWEELEKGFAKYSGNPRWWYCTQNEYAAYRYEANHVRIRKTVVNGKCAEWEIIRYLPSELGASVPLFLEVRGHAPVELAHTETLPQKIELAANDGNEPEYLAALKKFPGIFAGLAIQNGKLCFRLANHSGKTLSNLRLTVRLPQRHTPGVIRCATPDLVSGTSSEIPFRLALPAEAPFFYWVEADFKFGDLPARIHATVN